MPTIKFIRKLKHQQSRLLHNKELMIPNHIIAQAQTEHLLLNGICMYLFYFSTRLTGYLPCRIHCTWIKIPDIFYTSCHIYDTRYIRPLASLTREVNPRLANSPLIFNGRLANYGIISSVKEATDVDRQALSNSSMCLLHDTRRLKQICKLTISGSAI